jgi:LPXTG-motif cell wall-anchored protein
VVLYTAINKFGGIYMKNVIRTFLLLFIALFSFSGLNVYAETVPKTIQTASSFETIPGYLNGVQFSIKKTTNGKFLYCTDIHKSAPKNMTLTLVGEQDAGMTYLMVNGYPNKSITGNSNYDYYITQSAVWWYLDLTTGSHNLSDAFKSTAPDPYGLRPHMKKLAENAVKAKNQGYATPTLGMSKNDVKFELSSDGKYYVSSAVTLTASSIKDSIKVSLTGAPSGSVIIDSNGKTVTSVKSGAKVRIKVPVENITSLETSITLKATATGSVKKSYLYKPSSSAYQPVTMSVLYSEEKALSVSRSFTLKDTEVQIVKVDAETGKNLAGAKLKLTNASGKVVASWTTTTKAYVIKHLAPGKYTLEETEAPNGYKKSDAMIEVVITAGKVVTAKFENSKQEPTKVTIIKRDKETGNTLAGAKFEMKDSAGKVVASWTSTDKGHYIKGLPEGKYTIEEVEAPSGYIRSTEKQTVTLKYGKEITVTFYNEKIKPTYVTIIKRDANTGETLAGAKFEMRDSAGKVVASWTSTDKGHYIKGLPEGKYTIKEVEAPAGYFVREDEQTVTLKAGEEITVTFYNVKKPEELTIIKILKINGETGEALAGADLVLKDAEGNIIESWTTTTSEKVFTNLAAGTYYLSETKAPNGYELSDEVIEIEVKNDGNTTEVVFRNIPKVKVPDTGSDKSMITVIAGAILVILGGTVLFINTRKEA